MSKIKTDDTYVNNNLDTLQFSGQNFNLSFVRDELIHEIFESQAQISPNKTAIKSQYEELTYKELDEVTNKLANFLIEKGVKKGDVVGLYLQRGTEIIISLLAILKAGATYLPLDSDFPLDRVTYNLSDACGRFIITSTELISNEKDISAKIFYYKTVLKEASSYSSEKIAVALFLLKHKFSS